MDDRQWVIVIARGLLRGVEDIVKIIAANVKARRETAGLSQEDLAYKANVDRSYLWGIERGTRNPSVQVVARIADALETTAAELLTKAPR